MGFNPRAREGRDYIGVCDSISRRVSIHAPARGATVDLIEGVNRIVVVSIHAPARGATSRKRIKWFCNSVSIHAPARGATSMRA